MLLVQQLVLAAAAAVRKERLLVATWAVAALRRRVLHSLLRGDGRAIAMQMGGAAGSAATMRCKFFKKHRTRPALSRPYAIRSLAEEGAPQREQRLPSFSASHLPSPLDACGVDAAERDREGCQDSHGARHSSVAPPRGRAPVKGCLIKVAP